MPKPDTTLCRNFCAYYRPGKNEALMCQGFLVVHRLLLSGREFSLERPARAAAPDRRSAEGLRKRVCAACSFRASDCDHAATDGAATPCGGMVLLFHLLGTGQLTLEETGDETTA